MKHEARARTPRQSHLLKFHTDFWSNSNCTFVRVCACVIPIPLVLVCPF